MNEKEEFALAFRELEEETVHPSAQEIAQAIEGLGSPFSLSEVRAHAEWCNSCRQIAAEFESFVGESAATATAEADWQSMRQRLPAPAPVMLPVQRPVIGGYPWLAAAAGIAAVSAGTTAWIATRPVPQPVIVEKRVEIPASPGSASIANAGVVDLMPVGSRVRGSSSSSGAALPKSSPGLVTFIFNDAPVGSQVSARVSGFNGHVVWEGQLTRQSDVFTLALGADVLRAGPLTIELAAPGRPAIRYLIDR